VQKTADFAGPVFFSGEDALREVAKEDGRWNWALLGPDTTRLPLSGGGAGSVDEMREAIGNHAHSFGLLRMTFGVGTQVITKFIFVHVHAKGCRGMMWKPQMRTAILRFTSFHSEETFFCPEECTLKPIVYRLRCSSWGVSAKLITVEDFEAALEHHKEHNPDVRVLEQEQHLQRKFVRSLTAPRASVAQPEVTVCVAGPPAQLKQPVKLYAIGDTVEFWSGIRKDWVLDGEVEEVAIESCNENGCSIMAGSLKISFAHGTHAEWIIPSQVESNIRPSSRPNPPAPKVGYLREEIHEWIATQRSWRYFDLSKGFLRWWNSEADAMQGRPASNTVCLLGLQQQREGLDLKLWTIGSMGALHIFEAATEEEAEVWSLTLGTHASYTNELRDFLQTKRDNSNTAQQELLQFVKDNSVEKEVTEKPILLSSSGMSGA